MSESFDEAWDKLSALRCPGLEGFPCFDEAPAVLCGHCGMGVCAQHWKAHRSNRFGAAYRGVQLPGGFQRVVDTVNGFLAALTSPRSAVPRAVVYAFLRPDQAGVGGGESRSASPCLEVPVVRWSGTPGLQCTICIRDPRLGIDSAHRKVRAMLAEDDESEED